MSAPGPVYWNPIRAGRDWIADPLGAFVRERREYGDVVCTRIGPLRYYTISHPDHVAHVLQDNHRAYIKGPINDRTKVLIGEGLFTSEGTFWRRQRRLAQPAFRRQNITGFAGLMTECGRDMLDGWSAHAASGEPFDAAAEMSRTTLRVVGKALFSLDLLGDAATVGTALVEAIDFVTHRTLNILAAPMWLPTARNRRFMRARRSLDDVVMRIIRERRQAGSSKGDLLDLLLAARDEETGTGMSDRQLRDEVMTFVLAGHETTAVALSWTCYLLANHPGVAQRLRSEVTSVLEGREPTVEHLTSLAYTRMVVQETLRLYPPVWTFARQALQEDRIDDYRIPKGSMLSLATWLTHRHPDFWPEPDRFDPERFTPERIAARHKHAYLPFSAGPRVCIGAELAMMEACLLLAMMVQRYDISLAEPERVIEPDVKITLRPRGGIPMRVQRAPVFARAAESAR